MLLEVFHWFTAAVRIFLPLVTIKLKWSQVWALVQESLREAACVCLRFHQVPPAVYPNVSRFCLSTAVTAENNCVLPVLFCVFILHPGDDEYVSSPPCFFFYSSDNWGSIHGWLTQKSREQESVWVFWISVTHFCCFIPWVGIRFDKVELNINVITGGFCCSRDFFSPQLRADSSVDLARLRRPWFMSRVNSMKVSHD